MGIAAGSLLIGVVALRYHRGVHIGYTGTFLSTLGFFCITAGLWGAIKIGVDKDGSFNIEVGRIAANAVEAKSHIAVAAEEIQKASEKAKIPSQMDLFVCKEPGTSSSAIERLSSLNKNFDEIARTYNQAVASLRGSESKLETEVQLKTIKHSISALQSLKEEMEKTKLEAQKPVGNGACSGVSGNQQVVNYIENAIQNIDSAIGSFSKTSNNQVNKDASR